MNFQWVFEWLDDLKLDVMLALEVGHSHERGGEEKIIQWKPVLEYELRDETTNEEVVEVEAFEEEDEFDENDLVRNVILGLQAIKEQPSITKVLLEEEKKKWSSI